MTDEELLIETQGRASLITLNRPAALNALTHTMCLQLRGHLRKCSEDRKVALVVVQGAGDKAFCAGGDVRRLYDEGRAGGRYPYDFYADEYELNSHIAHSAKPYVALMDGIVMGGGVGVSVHGSHRIASEHVMFAMPETGIGLFPDVGGSYFLARLPGRIGMYMALTGARLKLADALYAGVCDHYVPRERLADLSAALGAVEPGEGAHAAVDGIIARFAEAAPAAPLAEHREAIDRLFDGDSVEAIVAALQEDGGEWALKQAEIIATKSPTSLKIAHEQIVMGGQLDFNDCMRMEFRIACGCIQGHDFYEGVRAVVIDKDQAPKWQPASLAEVDEEMIRGYFEDLPERGDLSFPGDAANDNFSTRFRADRRQRNRERSGYAGPERRTGDRRGRRNDET